MEVPTLRCDLGQVTHPGTPSAVGRLAEAGEFLAAVEEDRARLGGAATDVAVTRGELNDLIQRKATGLDEHDRLAAQLARGA